MPSVNETLRNLSEGPSEGSPEATLIERAGLEKLDSQCNPRLTRYRGMAPFSVCHAEDCVSLYGLHELGFRLWPEFNDGGHRHVWIHPERRAVFTYCEHDLILDLPVNESAGDENISELQAFYLGQVAAC